MSPKAALDDVAQHWVRLLKRHFGSSTLPETLKSMVRTVN